MTSVPTHKDWVKFKDKFEIPPHAVMGIDLGKSLDTYHNGLSHDFKKNAALALKVEEALKQYL